MIALRLAGVILLWFAALLLWNLSALRLRAPASFAGLLRLAAGALFVFAALFLLDTSFPQLDRDDFSFFAIGTFLTALVCDFLIGDDLRSLMRR